MLRYYYSVQILYSGIFFMAYKQVRGTIFCRITNVILNRIKKRRKINLARLKRILCSKFGNNYFCKRNHKYILLNAMEYLLYTKRLSLSNGPTRRNSVETNITVNNNEIIYSEYFYYSIFHTQYLFRRI